jgi:ureidoglycolate hydrolase
MTAMSMRDVPLEPLSAKGFAPYGWLLAGGDGPPSYARDGLELWRFPFESDAPLRLQVMRYHFQPMRFQRLERHLAVTEARFPAGGAAAVLIVAGATDASDPQAAPDPSDIRAFLLGGGRGVMFRPGIWHGLDCFPAAPPHADFLFMSDAATEEEIEAQPLPVSGRRTHVVDYALRDGTTFRVVDPAGLLRAPA